MLGTWQVFEALEAFDSPSESDSKTSAVAPRPFPWLEGRELASLKIVLNTISRHAAFSLEMIACRGDRPSETTQAIQTGGDGGKGVAGKVWRVRCGGKGVAGKVWRESWRLGAQHPEISPGLASYLGHAKGGMPCSRHRCG